MYGGTFGDVGQVTAEEVVSGAIEAITTPQYVFPKIELGSDQGVLLAGLEEEVLGELEEQADLSEFLSGFVECKRGYGLGLAFVRFDLGPIARAKLRSLSGVKGFLKNRIQGLRDRRSLSGTHRTQEGTWENTYSKLSLKEAWGAAKRRRNEEVGRLRHFRDKGDALVIVIYCRADTNDPNLPHLTRLHNSFVSGPALAQWVRANRG